MKVRTLRLRNFRSFRDTGAIQFGPLNVLIGANNSGKSSILRALHLLQTGVFEWIGDVRIGSQVAEIDIEVDEVASVPSGWALSPQSDGATFAIKLSTLDRKGNGFKCDFTQRDTTSKEFTSPPYGNIDPDHFIVPYLSKRKTISYSESVNETAVKQVHTDMSTLAAKISQVSNSYFPKHAIYSDACNDILGFVVTNIPSLNGQRPGTYLPDGTSLTIEKMGEGVPNIVYLLSSLVVSTDKLFLIEEPENDLHPHALKAMLNLIVQSSASNQFVISTHSNIVVSHLCSAAESRLFRVACPKGRPPTESHVEQVPASVDARISVLQELGYTFSDFHLWDGWLLLEESSAERIIRDFLIPWFAPFLSRIRTFAANGSTKIEPAFDDFHRLVLFTHLQPAYSSRIWVRVDGDQIGKEVICKLREKYKTIDADRFDVYAKPQFEEFYPLAFRTKVEEVLAISDRNAKRKAKQLLLLEVVEWLDEDNARGKAAIAETAQSVIEDLRHIQKQLLNKGAL